jgi:hypothetical protein
VDLRERIEPARGREREEREHVARAPLFSLNKKNVITHKQKNPKLNSDCTIEFVSINSSELDLTWIYLDKVTSGPHSE